MPYYLHRLTVAVETLEEMLTADPWPEGTHARDKGCECSTCIENAWTVFWNEHPDVARGFKPNAPDIAALILGTFDNPADAHTARKTLQSIDPITVSFIATPAERENWREREYRKVSGNQGYTGCLRVPWCHDPWYRDSLATLHHAYLSNEKPGLVAYTPSEEYGVADRQLRVRPGRYLEQFAPHLSSAERDALCARVKAIDDRNVIKFAVTADEIEHVYRNGPGSCMSHDADSYDTNGVHPVRVYGDSDLQLAYLENGDGSGTMRARALVWPDKKIFSRVYGDETIKYLLTQAGFHPGSIAGARVHKIRVSGDVFLMPYVDGIDTAEIDGKWFRFCGEDCDGEYKVQGTNGTTEENYEPEPQHYCGREGCDNECGEDDGYCSSCDDERQLCVRCDGTFFDDSPYEIDGHGVMCAYCYRNYTRACTTCDERFAEGAYSTRQQRERSDNDLEEYCLACGDEEMETRREAEDERVREREARVEREALADALMYALNTNGLTRRVTVVCEVNR